MRPYWLAAIGCAVSCTEPVLPPARTPEAPLAEPPKAVVPPLQLSEAEQEVARQLEQDVQRLTQEAGPRHIDEPWGLAGAADYVAGRFEELGFALQRHGYEVGAVMAQNLEVTVPGGTLGQEHVVVGAHYDTPPGPALPNQATGLAVLLALAQAFKADPVERTLHFVAYALSYPPHAGTDNMGSLRYAKAQFAQGTQLSLAVSLESVGHFNLASGSQSTPSFVSEPLPPAGDFVLLRMFPGSALGNKRLTQHLSSDDTVPLVVRQCEESEERSDAWAYHSLGVDSLEVSDTGVARRPAHAAAGAVDYARTARAVTHLELTLRGAANTP